MHNGEKKNNEIIKLTQDLVTYLTKYTDYLANPIIRIKDIAQRKKHSHEDQEDTGRNQRFFKDT